jgi:hydrogenase maturation factor
MVNERGTSGLAAGKVPPAVLTRLLSVDRGQCQEVVVGPAAGEDAAVLHLPGGLVAVTSDPVTFATQRPGHFAVCINANDIAAMGARPLYFTLTVLLPPGSLEENLLALVEDAVRTARDLGVTLIGGHTEVTDAVVRPVLSVTMFGNLVRPDALQTGGAHAGDAILQVGFLAIEGTAILASEHGERLSREVGAGVVQRSLALLEFPGICIVGPALRLAESSGVRALHDPTEGGLATGLREMATAAGLGVRVDEARLLCLPETAAVCACLGYDALGLISSGCLLAAVDPGVADCLVAEMQRQGWHAAVIGRFSAAPDEVLVQEDGTCRTLPRFGADELLRGG